VFMPLVAILKRLLLSPSICLGRNPLFACAPRNPLPPPPPKKKQVPLVFMPLVAIVKRLLLSPSHSSAAEDRLRSGLLLTSTLAAACVRDFGLLAGLIGCLTGFYAQFLPPLVHLRMVAMHEPKRGRRFLKVRIGTETYTRIYACIYMYIDR